MEVKKITEIPPEELSNILKQGALLRLPYLEGRLLQARDNIQHLEKKYNSSLHQIKKKGIPEDAGFQMHEDFIEWEYWDDVLTKTETIVHHLRDLIEEGEVK